MTQLENVTVQAQANVYFDGKCVSHTVLLADGTRKTVGVVLAAALTFGTEAPETMEVVGGSCRVRLAGSEDWTEYAEGSSFDVPANSSFDIEVDERFDYICSYG
ncbi:pyrimidine/purine nucleoside phosphorylase [Nocardioides marmorisolisilvae]|uniref:Pyrimidine/purine nucleoside phosphorylase n=1 Tax=Nocardioides marmorisolisilvae TaxID=1542737 RepID=A0A3N0E0D2_9ACTN|nr:pyrimidine/purine nucleoside phosphorylase [Nocardioides marmorisolisilvae]RNL81319.1 pyrimidine/purine nucleoside phosphorylase [Nocardioides marmorisolisilvae]